MGMYTEFVLAVNLKEDTPESVIDILRYMIHETPERPAELPDHPLFQTERWHIMLYSSSAYFPGTEDATLEPYYDGFDTYHALTVRTSLKNYDNEIELFLDWISEYIDDPEEVNFIGYFRREDQNEPTLIYYDIWSKSHHIEIGSYNNYYYKKPLLDYLPNLWFDWAERRSAK